MLGDGNSGFRMLSYFLYGDEHQCAEVHRRMWNELRDKRELYINCFGGNGRFYEVLDACVHSKRFAPRHCWMDIPDYLIIAANISNLCIVLVTSQDCCTVLSLYSVKEQMGNTIVVRHLSDCKHFNAVVFSLNSCMKLFV